MLNLSPQLILIIHSPTIYQERKSPFKLVLFRCHYYENLVMITHLSQVLNGKPEMNSKQNQIW
jgi:hypothetical protein